MTNKILVVDDHLIVRIGISMVLKKEIENLNIWSAENYIDALSLLKEKSFDLVILDIGIPGGKNVGMIEEIRDIQPNIKILIFSAFEEDLYACRYIISGANGYLNKLSKEDKIIEATRAILEKGKYIQPEIVNKIVESALNKTPLNPLDMLSKREFEIAELIVAGEGNLEICNKLDIQMSTVSTYKNRVFEKLKVTNIVDLIEIFKIYVY
ncbi:Oxygen regulatory protein NreC [compost metagenome]